VDYFPACAFTQQIRRRGRISARPENRSCALAFEVPFYRAEGHNEVMFVGHYCSWQQRLSADTCGRPV